MIAMNLKNRFRLIIFSMIALLVGIAVIAAIGFKYTNLHIQEAIGMDELVVDLYELQILNTEYIETPSERVKQQWRIKYDQISAKLIKQRSIPDDVKNALNSLQDIFERFISLPGAVPGKEASQKRIREQIAMALTLESQRVIDWASDISIQKKDSIVVYLIHIGVVMVAIMLVIALTAITIMIVTARHIFSSVNRLKEGAEEIASGKLGFQIEQTGNDEITVLATAINQMSLALMDSYVNLQEQTVQLETEMAKRQVIHETLKIKTVELTEEIEERKRAEEALQESEENYKNLIENANEAIFVAQDGKLVFINPMTTRLIGYSGEDLMSRSFVEFIHSDDRDMVLDRHLRRIKGEELPHIYSFRIIRGDRKVIWVELNAVVVNWKGKPVTLNFLSDITERKQMEEALKDSERRYRELSIVDDLTQLYNSRHFYFHLKIELNRSNRYGHPLTLLLLDIDNFKAFNDAYGHVEGDQVLRQLGQVVKKCLRDTDFAYRYGGEEFTILLPMTTSTDGAVTAERIRTEFKKETFSPVPGQEVHVTVSIGLAQYKPQEDMKAFVHRVDQLMYQGKKNGKDKVCCETYSPA